MFYRAALSRKRGRPRRAGPLLALAGVAFAAGALAGADHAGSSAVGLASRFVAAWTREDWATMYLQIDSRSRRSTSAARFAEAYEAALRTATATGARMAGKPRGLGHDVVQVPVRVRTRVFGLLALSFRVRVIRGRAGAPPSISWSPSLVFPGLRASESLGRRTVLPPRARLLARDGSLLGEGASEAGAPSSPLGDFASAVVGVLGAASAERRQALEAQGVPPDANVGTSGLELALDARLRGTPGGQLFATTPSGAERVLASAVPRAASPARTTISAALQRAAVSALGGQLGGIVALQPSTGQILAIAGIGLDGLQPPGSTFKMVTLSAVLQSRVATPASSFAYATHATLDGVKLSNANGESCGGTLQLAFAVSCNSVFAPLGVKVGAPRLVATAEAFGFNHDPGVPGAAESSLPAATQIQGELALGSTAIGQGQVQATPLQMAIVAATIADGGLRPQPAFLRGPPQPRSRALAPAVARTVRRLMVDVVREGTGSAAAIPGVVVAGKTGTAELKSQCQSAASTSAEARGGEGGSAQAGETGATGCVGTASNPSNTDAWFAAFAPARHPRIDVAVLLVKDGAGGETAAPVAREVLEAGLRRY
jgi:cell division protein FtsI/penicillin-binding protein 2